jgi:hypothetical protein
MAKTFEYPIVRISRDEFKGLLSTAPTARHFWASLKNLSHKRGLVYNKTAGSERVIGPPFKTWWCKETGDYCQQNYLK